MVQLTLAAMDSVRSLTVVLTALEHRARRSVGDGPHVAEASRATRQAFRDLRQIYRACGAQARCHLVVGAGGHRFYERDAWPMMMKEIQRLRS